MRSRRGLPVVICCLLTASSAAAAVPRSGPECDSELGLPFVLNAAIATSDRLGFAEMRELATDLFTALEARGVCAGERTLQVNLAVASEYHAFRWLEEGSGGVDMAVISDLALFLLQRQEIELLEVDLDALGRPELTQRILPHWRREVEVREIGGVGSVADAGAELEALRTWLWTGLADDPGRLAAVHREGEERCPAVESSADPGVRLTLPSHLSTIGMVDTVAETRGWLAERTAEIGDWSGLPAASLGAAAETCFWSRLFEHTCFTLIERGGDGAGGANVAPDVCIRRWQGEAAASKPPRPFTEVRVRRVVDDGTDGGAVVRDHLVVRRAQAEAIFGRPASTPSAGAGDPRPWPFVEPVTSLPDSVAELITAAASPRDLDDPLQSSFFRSFAGPSPGLGIRTFAFTPHEAMELLGIHQRFSDRRRLALVLPGGGVKAAFQSRILEKLYGQGLLRNSLHAADDAAAPAPLLVESVVGTSGGALLGFFVARLGPEGPWQLSEVLWKRASTQGETYLNAFDIFGSTDLLRYLSLLVIYALFAAVLGIYSLRHKGWLAPDRGSAAATPIVPSARPALLGLLVGVLGATPLLVRWANGGTSVEHVPEFEGLLFAILVIVAIFADQTLVYGDPPDEPADATVSTGPHVWSPPRVLLGLGLVLVATPLLLKLGIAAMRRDSLSAAAAKVLVGLEQTAEAWEAYLLVGAVAAGLILAAVQRRRRLGGILAQLGLFLLTFALGTAVALVVLRTVRLEWLGVLDRVPLLFAALAVALVLFGLTRLATGGPGPAGRLVPAYSWLASRWGRIRSNRFVRAGAMAVAPAMVCLVVLDLTRPVAGEFLGSWMSLLTADSKLATPRGGLMVALGVVLVTVGGVLALHHRRNRYRLDQPHQFVDGVVFVVLVLTSAVYLVLGLAVFALTRLGRSGRFDDSPLFQRLAELSLFELTPAFWVGLAVLTVLGSLGIIALARRGERRGSAAGSWLKARLEWLCSRHPNGHLVSRRFVRMGLFACGALAWWNFVLAPALYGNQRAQEYLRKVDARFEKRYRTEHHLPDAVDGDERRSYRLTTRFLAPANSLEKHDTHFLLAIPENDVCPQFASSPGVQWHRFRLVGRAAARPSTDGCEELVLADGERLDALMDFVFASGSPFPAFPPRRAGKAREALVDGGYSNLVPLDAAANLDALQALVIHSSQPVEPAREPGLLATVAGPLVDNVPRLFGFLFERSQQLDRRSRSRLFVVSLAPPYRPDWPLLTDFRRPTVEKMIREADRAFERRIGMVESWGPPFFQFNVTVPPPAAQ